MRQRAVLLFAAWLPLAPVQVERQEVAAAAVSGKVYVIGGIAANQSILSSVEEYDPATDTWRFVAPLPRPRHHHAAAVVGHAIYVIGGFETLAFDPQRTVYRYDTQTSTPRHGIGAAVIGDRIYIPSGAPGQGFSTTNVHDALDVDMPKRRAVRH